MSNLILCRHGMSFWNKSRRFTGWADIDLTEQGKSEAELPSCNLWIRTGFKAVYPEVESAEDHWLVAHLLIKHSDVGRLFPDILHAKYTLSGNTTQRNCASGCIRSRGRRFTVPGINPSPASLPSSLESKRSCMPRQIPSTGTPSLARSRSTSTKPEP